MKPLLPILASLFGLALYAQTGATLQDRIRSSSLPPDTREELLKALAAKDYARMEAVLGRQTSAGSAALEGAVEFLDGHMERAAQAFRRAETQATLDDPDRFTWAMALVNLGDAPAARMQLTRLNDAHPDRPLYLYWLARIDYDQRLYTEAVAKLRRVIVLDPSSARAYDSLGLALDMMDQTEEAHAAFLKAVDLNRKLSAPSCWPPHNLGAFLLRQQQLKEAEAALRESLRYDPGFPMAHYHLGRTLEAESRDQEAIAEYRAATTRDPVIVEAFYSLGLLCRRHGLAQEAEAAFAEYKLRK